MLGKGGNLKQRGPWDKHWMAGSRTAPPAASRPPERALMFPSSGIAVFRVRLSKLESLEIYDTSAFWGIPHRGTRSYYMEYNSITTFLLLDMHHSLLVRAWRKYWCVWHL